MTHSLIFDAVSEPRPGPKWRSRWDRSWPAYKTWFLSRGGDSGPDRKACEAALARYMPELVEVHRDLVRLTGDGDRAARFLSTWCPPPYLGGCSLAAVADNESVRLMRNYDLSPELNEGLMLHSSWTGRPVMGMVEFLWGLSDGINADGLAVALAFGGGRKTGQGFGICTILRYVLEICSDVPQALRVLKRVPSHMDYNLVLADRSGATASVEMLAGGGLRRIERALATNHQHGSDRPDRGAFTKTFERRAHLELLFAGKTRPTALAAEFLKPPLFQTDYDNGFGTLFSAEYDPKAAEMTLHWPDATWKQAITAFQEGRREIQYAKSGVPVAHDWAEAMRGWLGRADAARFDTWLAGLRADHPDWAAFGQMFANWTQPDAASGTVGRGLGHPPDNAGSCS